MTLEVVPAWQFLTREPPEAGGYTEQIALFPERFFRNTRVNYAVVELCILKVMRRVIKLTIRPKSNKDHELYVAYPTFTCTG
jgi:hypothetical protein